MVIRQSYSSPTPTLSLMKSQPKIKKYKGVTKNVTKRSFQFDDYRDCLFSRKEQHRKMNVYEVIVMTFIPKKLIKLPSLLTLTNELLWPTEYTL